MALDTNIALGVKPIEQPNMLAQMGQMMQIRQAQQEYESQNALRDAFSQGTDISDPAAFKRIAAINPKLAFDLRGKQLEQTQKGVETGIKINEALGGGLEWLSKNPSLDNAKNLFSDLVNKGVLPPDKAQAMFAKLQAEPDKIGYYANLGYQSAITAQAKLQDATSRANAATAAAPGHRQASLAEQKWAAEQAQLKAIQNIVSSGPVSSATAIPITMGTGGGVAPVTPSAGAAPVTPPVTPPVGAQTTPAGAVGRPNVLATQVSPPPTTSVPPQTTVNNLGQGSQKEQLVDQISQLARIPTTAASRALEMKVKEFNVLYPTEKIEQDRQGNLITIVNGVSKPVVNANGLPVQGKPLPETAFESTVGRKTGEDTVAFVNRAQAAPKNIAKIDEALGILKSGGAVTGYGAEARLNLERAMSLFGNDVKAGKRVVDTQILDALLGSDVFPSLQSMGLGSKNIDTPAEREFIRQVITGTIQLDNDALIRLTQIRRNVETNAIKEYNQKLGSGKFDKYSKAADQKLEKIEVPNPIIRKGTHKNGRSVIEYADGTVEYGN